MNLKFSPIKILIFLAAFVNLSSAFNPPQFGGYTSFFTFAGTSSKYKNLDASLIGESYIKYDGKIYEIVEYQSYFLYNTDIGIGIFDGGSYNGRKIFYYVPTLTKKSLYCRYPNSNYEDSFGSYSFDCRDYPTNPYSERKVADGLYYLYALPIATCKANENFNTQTKKCEAPCQKGQSWDENSNRCFNDCTDKNNNKWGFTDGSCIDCSGEKTPAGVMTCYCKYFGVKPDGYDQPGFGTGFIKIPGLYPEGFDGAECEGGIGFVYKDPRTDPVEIDNNKTGESGGGSKNPDSNSTNSGNKGDNSKDKNKDKDDNKTSPKDPKDPATPSIPSENGNQTATPANPSDPNGGGSNSGSGGGNNGGSGSGKGNDKSDFDGLKYNLDDFRLDDIESDVKGFSDSILKKYDAFISNFDSFREEYNRLMGLLKSENAFENFTKSSQVNSCPRSFSIEISSFRRENITIDICESLSKVRPALYSIFYIVFFIAFLYLTIKFSLRLFSNPFRVI